MNTTKKKLLSLGILYGVSLGILNAQNVGINTTGATPSKNAILDLSTGNSGNLGLIVPNVSLTALGTFNPPIANAATAGDKGMMIYNTNTAVGNGIGYYYWNGTTWVSVSGGVAATVLANNGLSIGTGTYAGYVELGGPIVTPAPLIQNSIISGSGFTLDFDLGTFSATGIGSFLVTNGGLGTPLLSVTSIQPGVGVNVNPAVSTLDDNGSFGVGTTKMVPSASTTTTLTGAYSTVIATPAGQCH